MRWSGIVEQGQKGDEADEQKQRKEREEERSAAFKKKGGQGDAPVDHNLRRKLRLRQSLSGSTNVLSVVVRSAVRAAKNDMAGRVSIRLDNCVERRRGERREEKRQQSPERGGRRTRKGNALAEIPCLVTERKLWLDAAEPMASMAIWREPSVPFLTAKRRSSQYSWEGKRKRKKRTADGHRHSGRELAVDLRLGGTSTDSTPRDQVCNVLRRNGVEEFAGGRNAHVGEFEKKTAGETKTLVDLEAAVELRV